MSQPNATSTPEPRRGRPLPFSLRERIAALRAAGASLRQIAAGVGISKNTAQKYARKFGTLS